MRQEVVFMGEMGRLREGPTPPYIMNGMGIPGGEEALEAIYRVKNYILGAGQRLSVTSDVTLRR
jgi:hypothetical protein